MVLSSEVHRVRPAEAAGLAPQNRLRPHLAAVSAASTRAGGRAAALSARCGEWDLKSRIERHLESFAEYLSDAIRIELDGDAIVVSGTVDSEDDRQLVMRIIGAVRDVRSIRDQIQVAYPGRDSDEASEPQALWASILGCWGGRP